LAELSDGKIIDFEVSACELICQKDMGKLIESTMLPTLTSGLMVVATTPLHIHKDNQGNILCKLVQQDKKTQHEVVQTISQVDLYVTGDLAFQAMAMGKESMQMQCTLIQAQLNDVKMWTLEELSMLGDEAEKQQKGEPKLGVKKKPWWPFIPVTHYIVPLLHCEIGIGNQLLDMLRDIINEHLENMACTKEITRASIPVLKNIISKTAANRDSWDASSDQKLQKTLKCKVEAATDRRDTQNYNEIIAGHVSSLEPAQQDTHATGKIKLKALEDYHNREYV
jgi:hypothetical protein